MDTIKVVCGIIFKNDKVFICRRKPEKSLGGYWEFPGGKIEASETPEQSLERELNEELGMKVTVLEHFANNIHDYGNIKIELIAFKCRFIEANFQLTDHDLIEWIDAKDLSNIKLAPADIPIAKLVLKRIYD